MRHGTVFSPSREQLMTVTEDLLQFIHRVALNEKATPAEIAALPEIAKVLYGNFELEPLGD